MLKIWNVREKNRKKPFNAEESFTFPLTLSFFYELLLFFCLISTQLRRQKCDDKHTHPRIYTNCMRIHFFLLHVLFNVKEKLLFWQNNARNGADYKSFSMDSIWGVKNGTKEKKITKKNFFKQIPKERKRERRREGNFTR